MDIPKTALLEGFCFQHAQQLCSTNSLFSAIRKSERFKKICSYILLPAFFLIFNPFVGFGNTATNVIFSTETNFDNANITGRDTTVCLGQSVDLRSLIEGTIVATTLEYGEDHTYSGNRIVTPDFTTTYLVRDSTSTTCSDTAQITVTITAVPSITGRDTTICSGEPLRLFDLVDGDFVTAWEYGTDFNYTAPIFVNPNSDITYFVRDSLSPACVDTAMINISVPPNPDITGRDTLVCAGEMVDLLTLVDGTTSGIFAFGTDLNFNGTQIVNPTSTTTFFIRDSVSTNCTDVTQVTVMVTPNPAITGVNTTICEGQSVDLSTLFTGTPAGEISYGDNLSFDGSITGIVNPTITTTYFVRDSLLTMECRDTAIIIVTVVPIPVIAGRDTAICVGEPVDLSVQFNGTSYGTLAFGTTLTFGGSNLVNPTANTTYFISDQVNAGCADTTEVVISIHPEPNITGRDTTICAGESILLYDLFSGTPLTSLEFGLDPSFNTTITPNPSPIQTTTYYVRDSVISTGCSDTTQITVDVQNPNISGMDTTICSGQALDLNLLFTGTTQGIVSYGSDLSFTGTAMITPMATTTTILTYYVRDSIIGFECADTATIRVTVYPQPAILGRDTTFCMGESIDLSSLVTGTTVSTLEFGTTTLYGEPSMVSPSTTTLYFVRDSVIATGCVDTSQILITINSTPNITGRDTTICFGQTVELSTLVNGTIIDELEAGTTLSFGGPLMVNPTTTTNYFLRDSIDGSGCLDTAQILVTVNDMPAISGRDTAICVGASVDLSTMVSGTPLATLEYDTTFIFAGLASMTVSPSKTTTYYVRDSVTATGCVDTAAIVIVVDPLPSITGRDTTLCAGESIDLSILINGTILDDLEADTSLGFMSSSMTVSPLTTTTYFLRDSVDATGCSDTARIIITIVPRPEIVGRDTTLCFGQTIILDDLISENAQGMRSYGTDFTFSGSALNMPAVTTTYFVRDSFPTVGCLDTAQITVNILNPSITGRDTVVCAGDSIVLTNLITGSFVGTADFGITLSFGGTSKVAPMTTTTYFVRDSIVDSGCVDTAQVTIIVNPQPEITARDSFICLGSSIDLATLVTGTPISALEYGTDFNFDLGTNGVVDPTFSTTFLVRDLVTATGCIDTALLRISVNEVDTTYLQKVICIGNSFPFNGQDVSIPGFYLDTLVGSDNCDSLIQLQVISQNIPILTEVSICEGDTFDFNGRNIFIENSYFDTLTSDIGCDSIIELKLSFFPEVFFNVAETVCQGDTFIFNNQQLTSPGIYLDTLTALSNGCDSLLRLTLNMSTVDTIDQPQTICQGSTFMFKNQTLDSTGVYFDTLTAASGCDSLIRLILTVMPPDTTDLQGVICEGSDYTFNNQSLNTVGTYFDTLSTADGCDSLLRLTLTLAGSDTTELVQILCNNQAISFNDQTISTEGVYIDTLIATNGCDSLLRLTIISEGDTLDIQESICMGGTFSFNNLSLDTAGIYLDTLMTSNGCDSLIRLNLTINPIDTIDIEETICSDSSFAFNNLQLDTAGVYFDTLSASTGCDSLIRLTLSFFPNDTTEIRQAICLDSTLVFNNDTISAAGIYLDTLMGANCDSIIRLTLSIIGEDTTDIVQNICRNDTFDFNGQMLTMTGIYLDTISSTMGCDSFVRLNLNIVDSLETILNETICSGDTYPFNGIIIAIPGTFRDTFSSVNGCDSFVVLNLSVQPFPRISIQSIPCAEDLSTYSVQFSIIGDSVFTSNGTLTSLGNNAFSILDVPADTNIVITINDSVGCVLEVPISAPSCNCDAINAPISRGDIEICQGDTIPTLVVGVDTLLTADWYDQPTGGVLLQSNDTTFVPINSILGIDTFYVVAKDSLTGCESDVRTPIALSIKLKPAINVPDTLISICEGEPLIIRADSIPGVTYKWFELNNPTAVLSTNKDFIANNATNGFAGDYYVQVTSAEGCVSDNSPLVHVTVSASSSFNVNAADVTQVSACGASDGTITINGFTIGDNYSISYTENGINRTLGNFTASGLSFTLINLSAGSYDNITVTETGNTTSCAVSQIGGGPFIIIESSSETPTIGTNAVVNPSECGATDGTITIGGLTNGISYQIIYEFNGNDIAPISLTAAAGQITIDNLASGTYSNFRFTNTNTNCQSILSTAQTLTDPSPISVNLVNSNTVQPTNCTNTCTGAFTFTGLMANATYGATYNFNNAAMTETGILANNSGAITLSGKCPGLYQNVVFINTSSQCSTAPFTNSIIINEPIALDPQIIANTGLNHPSGCGLSDGNIVLTSLAPNTSYTLVYTKDGVAQSQGSTTTDNAGNLSIPNLSAGNYNAFQTTNQATNCVSSVLTGNNFMLTDPAVGTISIDANKAINPSGCGLSDGSILIENLVPNTAYSLVYRKDMLVQNSQQLTSNAAGELTIANLPNGQYDNFVLTNQATQCTSNSVANLLITLNDASLDYQPTTPASISICQGQDLSLVINNANAAPAGATYTWTGPNGFNSTAPQPNILATSLQDAGVYSVVVALNGCTSTAASTTVNIGASPNIVLTQSGGNCGTPLQIMAQITSNIPNTTYSFQWTGPNNFSSTNQNVLITNPGDANSGVYMLAATSNLGCRGESTQSVQIINTTDIPPSLSANKQSFCEGETIELTTTEFFGNNVSYLWTLTSNNSMMFTTTVPTLSISNVTDLVNTGAYTVQVTVDGCTSALSNVQSLLVNPIPTAPTVVPTVSVCEGEALNLTATIDNNFNYQWTGPGGFTSNLANPQVAASAISSQSGIYTLQTSVNNCLAAPVQVIATVNAIPTAATVSNNSPICEGSTLELSVNDPIAGAVYEWFNQDNQPMGNGAILNLNDANASLSGDYYVAITNNGCTYNPSTGQNVPTAAITTVTIAQQGSITANAGADGFVCENSYGLMAEALSNENAIGQWTQLNNGTAIIMDDQESETPVSNLSPGNNIFLWTVSNTICNGTATDTVNVFFSDGPSLVPDVLQTDFNTPINIEVLDNDPINPDNYSLQVVTIPNGGSASLIPDKTITYFPNPNFDGEDTFTYQVCAIDCPDQCALATVNIEVVARNKDFFMPTVITPNNDGLNDQLVIAGLSKYPNSEIVIFNRWGDEVYRDANYKNDWEGLYKTAMLPVGTYYYVVQVNDPANTRLAGYVYIQRE